MERLEHAGRDLKASAAVLGASLVALVAPGVASAEPVAGPPAPQGLERPVPALKTGDYEGFTSQACNAEAAAEELCEAGKKIPVSLTAAAGKIINFESAATTICYSGSMKAPAETFPVAFKQVKMDNKRGFSGTQLRYPGPVQKSVIGTMGGFKVRGELSFASSVSDEGEPATNGDKYCQTPPVVSYEAEFVG